MNEVYGFIVSGVLGGAIVSPNELRVYALLFLVIGAMIVVLSLAYRNEELGAIAVPLLVISATIITGSWGKWSIEVVYKYFMYGVLLTLVLEIISYALYVTVAGKAVSLSILFGIVFFLLYEYIVARRKRKTKEIKEAKKPIAVESSSEVTGSTGEGEKEG